jgi:hypothetical protein
MGDDGIGLGSCSVAGFGIGHQTVSYLGASGVGEGICPILIEYCN